MLILIPCKNLDQGKSRLAPHLDPHSRRALCERFLSQTLALATSLVPAAEVRVISGDQRASGIGAEYGVSSIPDRGDDLNAALSGARNELMSELAGEPDVLVLPIDLPYATPAALQIVLGQQTDIVIAPDHKREGTNLLFLRSRAFQGFPFAFGGNSFDNHRTAAISAGLTIQIVDDDRLAFDVDKPEHYWRWLESTGRPAAPSSYELPARLSV